MTQTGHPRALALHERPYSITREGAPGTLRLHGTIDELSAPGFLDDLRVAMGRSGGAGTTLVDLRDVDYFCAAAVGALVSGWSRARASGASMEVVVRPGSVPQRVLSVCGMPHRRC